VEHHPVMRALSLLALLGACASPPSADPALAPVDRVPVDDSQAVSDWVAGRAYLAWDCQMVVHEPPPPSVHGRARVCANGPAAGHTAGEFPVGAAHVKELYAADDTLLGVTLAVHTRPGDRGDAWFWFEQGPTGITADGWFGDAVAPCISCHEAAGSDADHPGHDFVYTTSP
jgi:hypothetical protein